MAFQQLCRGYLARREYKIKLGAIITIQAGFRMVLAKSERQRRKKEVCIFNILTRNLLNLTWMVQVLLEKFHMNASKFNLGDRENKVFIR